MSNHPITTGHEMPSPHEASRVTLYWLPLGAGGRSVRWNGRVFEALAARRERRPGADLYHSALDVEVDGSRFVIEMTPAWQDSAADRGVVLTGPDGSRILGTSVLFRYEVRRWRNGVIPDLSEAVGEPCEVSHDTARARHLLALVPQVPPLTWGRDELGTGDMWNSNSLTAWLLAGSGHSMDDIHPPARGRAPGWDAGHELSRMLTTVPSSSTSRSPSP
jgi:hypothetical protein